jgi:hypothetical protein
MHIHSARDISNNGALVDDDGCVKQIIFYVVLIRNNIRCINNFQEMEIILNNVINE